MGREMRCGLRDGLTPVHWRALNNSFKFFPKHVLADGLPPYGFT